MKPEVMNRIQEIVIELFKVRSGEFIGWRVDHNYYSADGKRAGRFLGDRLYADDGTQIGWVYPLDQRRIGLRNSYELSSVDVRTVTAKIVDFEIPLNLSVIDNESWTDPQL
jgi:hypothetical protein